MSLSCVLGQVRDVRPRRSRGRTWRTGATMRNVLRHRPGEEEEKAGNTARGERLLPAGPGTMATASTPRAARVKAVREASNTRRRRRIRGGTRRQFRRPSAAFRASVPRNGAVPKTVQTTDKMKIRRRRDGITTRWRKIWTAVAAPAITAATTMPERSGRLSTACPGGKDAVAARRHRPRRRKIPSAPATTSTACSSHSALV